MKTNRNGVRRSRQTIRGSGRKRRGRPGKGKSRAIGRTSAAWRYGRAAAEQGERRADQSEQQFVQEKWLAFSGRSGARTGSYKERMSAYLSGYFSVTGSKPPDWLLLPATGTVAAVVMAKNEEQSIEAVIAQLERMPLHEIVVVINGSTDQSLSRARTSERAVLLHYSSALGHDVGRAIGARATVSDIVLFLDADIPIAAEKLLPFIEKAANGADVVLNDLSPYIGLFGSRDEVTMLKEFLNRSVGREDLSANSLTAVPHALTRHAIQTIGAASLAVPPKAQAMAVKGGLRVVSGSSVDVIGPNRVRRSNTGTGNAMVQLIVGDHLEALDWAMGKQRPRLQYEDHHRKRSVP
ncbi:glycosyltransferase family 2 protein [Paenibacillus sp. NPDC058071]|uniref:glycosyltransferase family 2 protein n=1 Tax=Paenibacillus sp. NPDC058071 TaxID=3346326 RepID=UPI0036D8C9C3